MNRIKIVVGGLMIAICLAGCGALQPTETRTISPTSGNQGVVRTRLEQALFNEIVQRFTKAHPAPVDATHYQGLLTELEQTVALTDITQAQQQTLKAVRWSVDRANNLTANAAPLQRSPAFLDAWLEQELKQLRQIRAQLGPADPSLFQTVGSTREARQQFLGLIQSSIATHRLLNPLELKFSGLPPLLVKPYLLAAEAPFFYQQDDASIRITEGSFPGLHFPEAEVIALLHGLPGSHFLKQQADSTHLFAMDLAQNQKALAILMLAIMGQVNFYQTPYSQIARIDFLILTLAGYQKALRPEQTFEQFQHSIGMTHYAPARLQQAFTTTDSASKPLAMQAQTLHFMSDFVGLSMSAAQQPAPNLSRHHRDQILSLINSLNWPLDAILKP